jgi:uncharacterized protein (TIGR00255 family)
MTGFAAMSEEADGQKVHVTLKSVNHRFLDVVVKTPAFLAPCESRVRALVQQRLVRGRVEVALGAEFLTMPEREVVLDEALLDRIAQVLDHAKKKGVVTGSLSVSDVVRIPQVLDIRVKNTDAASGLPAEALALVERVVGAAIEALVVMRETEGRFLGADLEARLATFGTFVDDLARRAHEGQGRLETRLRERLASLPADLVGDGLAVAQEVVRFVARSDVDEEVVRLRGHISHWRELAGGPEACGRKLDFLVQEMNREINTIGAKVEGPGATEVVIAAKAELERVREQVQNVE